jgi:hypothetical protein
LSNPQPFFPIYKEEEKIISMPKTGWYDKNKKLY